MKKWINCFLGILLVFGLAACSSSNPKTQETVIDNQPQENNSNRILIVYFSMSETSSPTDMSSEEDNSTVVIDNEVMGNTQYFASIIQEYTQGKLFRIKPVTPYPTNHDSLIELASTEQKEDARPLIKNSIDNFEQYDIVFVGYPNWWGDMPMILYTFFNDYDFKSKTIIPFNTHGGSGFSNTIETIKELEPAAIVSDQGLSVSRNEIDNSKPTITTWLDELAINKTQGE